MTTETPIAKAPEYDHQQTTQLLNDIYNDCHMASQSIMTLNKYIDKDPLDKIMNSMSTRYTQYIGQITNLAHSLKCDIKSTTGWAQLMANMSTRMQMMTHKNCSHAVKILVQGIFMGVIDINSTLNAHTDIQVDALSLARDILSYHQQSIDKLKEYL